MRIFRIVLPVSMVVVLTVLPDKKVSAQFIVGEVLNQTVGKIIRAIDLGVQRAQNKTIWLQNAQKVVETQLNQLKLTEVAGIGQQQTDLFSKYYNELLTVKSVISQYQRVREITLKQSRLVQAYQRAWSLTRQDTHFTAGELEHISSVYTGILTQSLENLDQLMVVVNSFKTQMTDGERLERIEQIGGRIDHIYGDLKKFNNQNILLSLGRARDALETQSIQQLYDLH